MLGTMFNILCQFVPVFMYVSYQSDSSFLSSLLHHGHFLVFYQTPPSHNKMHQQAWPAVILFIIIKIFFGKLSVKWGVARSSCTQFILGWMWVTKCFRHSPPNHGLPCGRMFLGRSELATKGFLTGCCLFLKP